MKGRFEACACDFHAGRTVCRRPRGRGRVFVARPFSGRVALMKQSKSSSRPCDPANRRAAHGCPRCPRRAVRLRDASRSDRLSRSILTTRCMLRAPRWTRDRRLDGALEDIAKVIAHDERNVLARAAGGDRDKAEINWIRKRGIDALSRGARNPYILYQRAWPRFARRHAAASQVIAGHFRLSPRYVPAHN